MEAVVVDSGGIGQFKQSPTTGSTSAAANSNSAAKNLPKTQLSLNTSNGTTSVSPLKQQQTTSTQSKTRLFDTMGVNLNSTAAVSNLR